MARLKKLKPPSLLFLALLLALGGTTLGMGVLSLKELSHSYREQDLVYGESPQAFRLWYLQARQHWIPDDAFVKMVADRLILMRVDQRRKLVHALMSDDFLDSLSRVKRNRRVDLDVLSTAVLQALASS